MTRGSILCFHSITTPALAAAGTAHVSADVFCSLVSVARQLGRLVPLSELLNRHAQGRSTAGLVALTFDDAYAAVLTELKDFISRHGVPISLFPVTNAARTGATFWWDRVDDLFPRVSSERWRAFEIACGLPEAYRQGQPAEYGPLRPLRQWLLAAYSGRWPDHLEPALEALEQETGYRTVHRSMTFDELATLASMREVELGVHTMSHPVLPLLPDEQLRHEIAAAYDELRERFARVLPVLAVPFGLYDRRTIGIASAAGMTASLTLAGGLKRRHGDYSVPRHCVTTAETRFTLGLRLLGLKELAKQWLGHPTDIYPDLPSPTT